MPGKVSTACGNAAATKLPTCGCNLELAISGFQLVMQQALFLHLESHAHLIMHDGLWLAGGCVTHQLQARQGRRKRSRLDSLVPEEYRTQRGAVAGPRQNLMSFAD